AIFRLVELHASGRFESAISKHDVRSGHYSTASGINERGVFPYTDLSATHPVIGPLDVDVLKVRPRSSKEHRIETAEQRDVLVNVLVPRCLKSDGLSNHVGS